MTLTMLLLLLFINLFPRHLLISLILETLWHYWNVGSAFYVYYVVCIDVMHVWSLKTFGG